MSVGIESAAAWIENGSFGFPSRRSGSITVWQEFTIAPTHRNGAIIRRFVSRQFPLCYLIGLRKHPSILAFLHSGPFLSMASHCTTIAESAPLIRSDTTQPVWWMKDSTNGLSVRRRAPTLFGAESNQAVQGIPPSDSPELHEVASEINVILI
jgi:hypothetical protein